MDLKKSFSHSQILSILFLEIMFEFLSAHKHLPKHLFFSSFVAFMILNFVENFIHYNTGKFHDTTQFHFTYPSKQDFLKILLIMFIFAIFQGLLTLIIYKFT